MTQCNSCEALAEMVVEMREAVYLYESYCWSDLEAYGPRDAREQVKRVLSLKLPAAVKIAEARAEVCSAARTLEAETRDHDGTAMASARCQEAGRRMAVTLNTLAEAEREE